MSVAMREQRNLRLLGNTGAHAGNPLSLLFIYRQDILSSKKKFKTARALIHYRQILATYLRSKEIVFSLNLQYTTEYHRIKKLTRENK